MTWLTQLFRALLGALTALSVGWSPRSADPSAAARNTSAMARVIARGNAPTGPAVRAAFVVPNCQTFITITQVPASPHDSLTGAVSVEYGELMTTAPSCLMTEDYDPSLSFHFTVNGVDRTSAFTINATGATANALPLVAGTNTLIATIQGHDATLVARTDSDTDSLEVVIPIPPTGLVLSPAFGSAMQFHLTGSRQDIVELRAANTTANALQITLTPSSSSGSVLGNLQLLDVASNSSGSTLNVTISPNSTRTLQLSGITGGAGAARLRVLGQVGTTILDSAVVYDSVTAVLPTITVPGDTMINGGVYTRFNKPAELWLTATNGPTPATWQFTPIEPNPSPVLSALSGGGSISFAPNETKRVEVSALVPNAPAMSALCLNIDGYGRPTKQVCGEVRSRPTSRVITLTNTLSGNDTLPGGLTSDFNGRIVLRTLDATTTVDNLYSTQYFLRARSSDPQLMRVTGIRAVNTSASCPAQTWSGDSAGFNFRGTSTPTTYSPCLVREFIVTGKFARRGGSAQLLIAAGNLADRENRVEVAYDFTAIPPFSVAISNPTPLGQYVPVNASAAFEYVLSAERAHTWRLTAAVPAGIRLDSLVRVSSAGQTSIWNGGNTLDVLEPLPAHHERRTYRLFLTPTASTFGSVSFTATGTSGIIQSSTASGQVTSSPSLTLNASAADVLDDQTLGDQCLAAPAGPNATWRCGQLLISHGTVPYMSRGEPHSLALVYNSATAVERIVLPVVVQPLAGQAPVLVRVIARIGSDTLSYGAPDTAVYDGVSFAGAARRLAIGLRMTDRATGRYRWRVDVAPINNGVAGETTTLQGALVYVSNRRSSRIGTGWQLGNVDRIFWAQPGGADSSVVIVEGDGSGKLFSYRDGGWIAPRGDFTTLRQDTSGRLVRRYKSGVEKWYAPDSTVMVRATSPLDTESRYFWSLVAGQWQIDSLLDEAKVMTRLYYGSTGLDSVRAPDLPGVKALRLARQGGELRSVQDPDGRATTFGYIDSVALSSRSGRLTGQVTSFAYGNGYIAREAMLGSDRLGFRARDAVNYADGRMIGTLASPLVTSADDTVLTVTPSADTTRYAVDAFQAATYVRTPLGVPVRITRNAMTRLVEEVRQEWAQSGIAARYAYDADGDLRHSSTRWRIAWQTMPDLTKVPVFDSTWVDYTYEPTYHQVRTIVAPDGPTTEYFYTGASRDSVQVGGVTQARFEYLDADLNTIKRVLREGSNPADTTKARRGQLHAVYERGHTDPTVFGYGAVGNVTSVQSPEQGRNGVMTRYLMEPNGVWLRGQVTPRGDSTLYTFDDVRRPLTTTFIGHAAAPAFVGPKPVPQRAERVVSYQYSDAGRTTTVTMPGRSGTLRTMTETDAFGRVTRYCPYSASTTMSSCDLSYYDSGRLVRSILRNGGKRNYQYTALGQVKRIVDTVPPTFPFALPEPRAYAVDTLLFDYDQATQQLSLAKNRVSVIVRKYRGPFLRHELQRIGNFARVDSAYPDVAPIWHFRYSYDRRGRVVKREMGLPRSDAPNCPPDQNPCDAPELDFTYAPNSDTAKATVTYHYNDLGQVDTLGWGGLYGLLRQYPARTFAFSFDSAGRWNGLTNSAAAGVATSPWTMTRAYNADDQLDAVTWGAPGLPALYDTLALQGDPNYERDADGRPQIRIGAHLGPARLSYDAFGQVVQQGSEWMQYDSAGAGHLIESQFGGPVAYNALGQLYEQTASGITTRFAYDASGNRVSEDRSDNGYGAPEVHLGYNSAGQTISRRSVSSDPGNTTQATIASVYWYDALGRRVLESDSITGNSGKVKRFYYEAAGPSAGEVAYELHNPQRAPQYWTPDLRSYGSRIFVPGPMGPNHRVLFIAEEGYGVGAGETVGELFVQQDGQNSLWSETDVTGRAFTVVPQYRAFGAKVGASGPGEHGTLGAAEGAGGLVYLRNRYYDPNSGQFTQEDPIGQAGGLNIYGYAGNDPVTFSDPFGLKFCLEGDRKAAQEALQDATDSDFKLDKEGCIDHESIQSRGHAGYAQLRGRLYGMAESSSKLFTMKITSGGDAVTIPTAKAASINVGDEVAAGRAYARIGGRCVRTEKPTTASVTAHEALGHAFGLGFGSAERAGGQNEAIRVENMFYAANNMALRDPACGD